MSNTQTRIIVCPHCGRETQYGLTVCQGCQAEIIYGPTCGEYAGFSILGGSFGFSIVMCFVVAVGFILDRLPPNISNTLPVAVGFAILANGLIGAGCGLIFLVIGAIIGSRFAAKKYGRPRFIRGYKY